MLGKNLGGLKMVKLILFKTLLSYLSKPIYSVLFKVYQLSIKARFLDTILRERPIIINILLWYYSIHTYTPPV